MHILRTRRCVLYAPVRVRVRTGLRVSRASIINRLQPTQHWAILRRSRKMKGNCIFQQRRERSVQCPKPNLLDRRSPESRKKRKRKEKKNCNQQSMFGVSLLSDLLGNMHNTRYYTYAVAQVREPGSNQNSNQIENLLAGPMPGASVGIGQNMIRRLMMLRCYPFFI